MAIGPYITTKTINI